MSVGHSTRQDIFSAAASWTKPRCWPSHEEAWGWNNSPCECGHGSRGNRVLPLTQCQLCPLPRPCSSACHCPLLTADRQTAWQKKDRSLIWESQKAFPSHEGWVLLASLPQFCLSGERYTPWEEWTIQFVFHVVLKMFSLSDRYFKWVVPIIRNKIFFPFWTKVSLW